METVADFIFLGSKITADGDCSHEIKRRLLLGRKVPQPVKDLESPSSTRLDGMILPFGKILPFGTVRRRFVESHNFG